MYRALKKLPIFLLLLAYSCRPAEDSSKTTRLAVPSTDKDYIGFTIAMDTLPFFLQKKAVHTEDSLLNQTRNGKSNPFYYYFKAKKFFWANQTDSALLMCRKMDVGENSGDVYLLKEWLMLDQQSNNGIVVESNIMSRIQLLIQNAEKINSRITYRFYDLAAKAFYQNRNNKAAATYLKKYLQNHPYKWQHVIKQRYYDASFLLASRMENIKNMTFYNNEAFQLAKKSNNTAGIARTFDNQAQIYALKGMHNKSLSYSKLHVKFLKKTKTIHDIAYYNLALSFFNNKQIDSAIFYYQKAIELNKKNNPHKPKYLYYKRLKDCYAAKKNYLKALEAAELAHTIEINNIKEIEIVKIEEIQAKYQAEKKDKNIMALVNRNQLNEKLIQQQQWQFTLACSIFIALLVVIYFIYRQRQLKQKNKLLKVENIRLNIEQKLLQAQLNPHFIFNAIANLQGLAATGNAKDTVDYLIVFSSLLRSVLDQNRRDLITIEEEISSLTNYLKLQQMRFANLFDYQIATADEIDTANTLIPPMFLQPFVENAIEHGFRNIDYKGLIKISFSIDGQQLAITVEDNGRGLTADSSISKKKRSLASSILKERLDLLFNTKKTLAELTISNKTCHNQSGVTVQLNIPYIKE